MGVLETTHVLLLGIWLGLVLVESLLEFAGPRLTSYEDIARLHFWIDICLEAPLVVGVLLTGVLLLPQMGPVPPVFQIKIIAGLVAIASNLYCFSLVLARYRRRNHPEALKVYTTRILWCWVGFPFGITALGIGLARMTGHG